MAIPVDPSWFLALPSSPLYVAGGDLDADGLSDVVVASGDTVSVYRGRLNGPLPTPVWEWTATLTSSHVGEGLAIADLDRDGYGDLVVGSPTHVEYVSTGRGAVFVFRGGPAGLPSTPSATYLGLQEFGELGRSVAVADVDNDGRPDLVAGASGWTVSSGTNESVVGAVFVYPGSGVGLPADVPQRVMTGTAYGALGTRLAIGTFDAGDGDIAVTNPLRNEAVALRGGSLTGYRSRVWAGGDGFATSMAAGDFDADGFDDVALGTWEGPLDCAIASPVGVDVYAGEASAPAALPVFSEHAGWESTGFGRDVAVGHFDGDAFADLIVAAPCLGDGTALEFRGSAGGPATRPTWQGTIELPVTNLPREFASSVSSAGDVNGDGLDDLLVAGNGMGVYLYLSEPDQDDDGVSDADDCAPNDASRHPFALEITGDGIDQDCDGVEACFVDRDGDGHGAAFVGADLDCKDAGENADALDCDDLDLDVTPDAVEIANDGVDQDCDGFEDCPADADGDGWSGDELVLGPLDCVGEGLEASHAGDCDDEDSAVNPGADERWADGVDQDCDGTEICYADVDADGAGGDGPSVSFDLLCDAPGEADFASDCDDTNGFSNPDAAEVPADGVDQDCDGEELCFRDLDQDGYGSTTTAPSEALDCRDPGTSTLATDCDDTDGDAHPAAVEVAGDGVDQDCDGADLPDEVCFDDCDGKTCGCATGTEPSVAGLVGALVIAMLARRRR